MKEIQITRVLNGACRGSSRPIIAETTSGTFFIKLRGAAQGCGALIAEVVVSEIARELGLNVLPTYFAKLNRNTPTDDKNDELADLLNASHGLNLALPFLKDFREILPTDIGKLTLSEKAATLWLDKFVMNPDRNNLNTNLIWHKQKVYLIDHGASLRFQYSWQNITELSPKEVGQQYAPHIFESLLESKEWEHWEELFSKLITRKVLQRALSEVPDTFIESLNSELLLTTNSEEEKEEFIHRRKEAYIAFLWKRLKTPRNFARCKAKCDKD